MIRFLNPFSRKKLLKNRALEVAPRVSGISCRLHYNPAMMGSMLSDRLLQFLLLILAIVFTAWVLDMIVYPFGILILLSGILARTFHLYGVLSKIANPQKTDRA